MKSAYLEPLKPSKTHARHQPCLPLLSPVPSTPLFPHIHSCPQSFSRGAPLPPFLPLQWPRKIPSLSSLNGGISPSPAHRAKAIKYTTTKQLTPAQHEILPRATVEANFPLVCPAMYSGQHERDYTSLKAIGIRWPTFAFGLDHVEVANNMFFVPARM